MKAIGAVLAAIVLTGTVAATRLAPTVPTVDEADHDVWHAAGIICRTHEQFTPPNPHAQTLRESLTFWTRVLRVDAGQVRLALTDLDPDLCTPLR